MKVVLVSTSASKLKDHDTGLWIEELAAPYYLFKEAKYEVVIASPLGGAIPIDKGSMGEGFFTDDAKKFMVSVLYVYNICTALYRKSLYTLYTKHLFLCCIMYTYTA